MQGASEQCMHATEIDFSPGTPSLSVTTRRRLTPHGMSCSLLHAVTQPLHSMQRSASHRNFILAMLISLDSSCALCGFADLTQRGLGFLHHGHDVVTISRRGVDGFTAHDGCSAFRIFIQQILALEPAGEMERQEDRTRRDALSDL